MGICSIYAHHDCQAALFRAFSFSSIAGEYVKFPNMAYTVLQTLDLQQTQSLNV